MESIIFLGLLSLTYLIAEGAAPVQYLKKLLNIHNESTTTSLYKQVLKALVNCSMCSGFWIGLLFYSISGYDHFILYACLTSIGAEIFTRTINALFSKILNNL
jgi:hypothetical protein